jgi:hypothetical protein
MQELRLRVDEPLGYLQGGLGDLLLYPTLAAYYMNWSEYLTWRDPRQLSYDQYQLRDGPLGNFRHRSGVRERHPKARLLRLSTCRSSRRAPVTRWRSGAA